MAVAAVAHQGAHVPKLFGPIDHGLQLDDPVLVRRKGRVFLSVPFQDSVEGSGGGDVEVFVTPLRFELLREEVR